MNQEDYTTDPATASYQEFLATKILKDIPTGIDVPLGMLPEVLFDWQAVLVQWALKRGRAAIFANTGLGKTIQQLAWSMFVPGRVLILAPLAVTHQTIREARDKLDLDVRYVRTQEEMGDGISITNYDRLENFVDCNAVGIVLDESSCLKALTSKTRAMLIERFTHIPFRLCCSATPAPNDISEIANHSEFLGVMTRTSLLSTFFVHDDTGWRLRGHAKDAFFRWLSSWAMALRSPEDIGYDGTAFALPPLTIIPHFLQLPWVQSEELFPGADLKGITDRIAVRQQTAQARAEYAVKIIRENLIVNHQEKVYNLEYEKTTTPTDRQGSREGSPFLLCPQRREECCAEETSRETDPRREGCEKRIHAAVAQEKSRQGETTEREDKGEPKCPQTGTICQRPNISGEREERIPGMVSGSPRNEEERSPTLFSRNDARSIRDSLGNTEESVCDLRAFRHDEATVFPSSGSLPCDRGNPWTFVHELQYGPGEIQGQSDISSSSNQLSGKDQWLLWCGLNTEQNTLAHLLGEEAVSIHGSTNPDKKLSLHDLWLSGERKVLISKPSVFGHGMNWQHCHMAIFCGLSDSWESWFQAIRRIWRYGQRHPVTIHVVLSEHEKPIWENIQRKEREAMAMIDGLIEAAKGYQEEVLGIENNRGETRIPMELPLWLISAHVHIATKKCGEQDRDDRRICSATTSVNLSGNDYKSL